MVARVHSDLLNIYISLCPITVNKGDLEDYLGDLMDQEFDTLIEDGSLESVSSRCDLWTFNIIIPAGS